MCVHDRTIARLPVKSFMCLQFAYSDIKDYVDICMLSCMCGAVEYRYISCRNVIIQHIRFNLSFVHSTGVIVMYI